MAGIAKYLFAKFTIILPTFASKITITYESLMKNMRKKLESILKKIENSDIILIIHYMKKSFSYRNQGGVS